MFTIARSGRDHHYLVQKPMWDSFLDLLDRNPVHRFTDDLLKGGLAQVCLALQYMNLGCGLVHTGRVSGVPRTIHADVPW